MLPGLKSRINAQLVAVAKEHAAYGDAAESTVIAYRYLHKYTLLIVAAVGNCWGQGPKDVWPTTWDVH
jgi:hypothetical protein